MKRSQANHIALLAIVLAAFSLRLFRLGAGSLWYDETVSTYLAGSPVPELIRHTAGDIHPPAYYLLLRGWLILAGFPTGHADPRGQGLEFSGAFFSLFFGVVLIALTYCLACRLSTRRIGVVAALLAALSPFGLWYSQEVRMYSLAASLGLLVVYAEWRATADTTAHTGKSHQASGWWAAYAVSAAAGLYTLYYFAFLLIPVSTWALFKTIRLRSEQRSTVATFTTAPSRTPPDPGASAPSVLPSLAGEGTAVTAPDRRPHPWLLWLLSNAAAIAMYAPWLPVALRQALQPPVPPWRTAVALGQALVSSWTALVAGQSVPAGLWPVPWLFVPVYLIGLTALRTGPGRRRLDARFRPAGGSDWWGSVAASPAALLFLATFGSLLLVLLASALTPLFHVRYVFIYGPYLCIVMAAGFLWLWSRRRPIALASAFLWCALVLVTDREFFSNPSYQPDDHRGAVAYLEDRWRPGDVLLVNAGYVFTAIATYWQGPVAWRGRLLDTPSSAESGPGLILVTTGTVDGGPQLGWGDPRSDFYPMAGSKAQAQLRELFEHFGRVWQYRVYDTVSDPRGLLRETLDHNGRIFEDRVFSGEANLRVQGYLPIQTTSAASPSALGSVGNLEYRLGAPSNVIASGATLYRDVFWRPLRAPVGEVATSVRLLAPDNTILAQPIDEHPLGSRFLSPAWPAGIWQRQTLALPIPPGTPPGIYAVQLVVYDPTSGEPWPACSGSDVCKAPARDISLGMVMVQRPIIPPAAQPALATFGTVAVLEASTTVTAVSPGDQVPVSLLWQALAPPQEQLTVVLQLLDSRGHMAASVEAAPAGGRYATQNWSAFELVRDQQVITLPKDLVPGQYRLILGVYKASDRTRLRTRSGVIGTTDAYEIRALTVKGP